MATVTERPRTQNLVESHRKVRDPLQHLRGLIRRYVVTEALTTLLLCVAACFWVGLLLDFASFKLGIDWVQDLPRWFRALLLGSGLLAICFVVELRKVLKIRTALTAEHVPGATGLFGKVLHDRRLLAATAAPLVILYLAAWIGIALWLDNGGLAPVAVGLFVFALLAGFAALIVVKRLLYDFRDTALALVLEKRYPELLGDRLITAVELHNPAEAARYGYSEVMIEETIHEAGRRVGKLPVREVFDWKRLYYQGGSAIGLTAGVYLLSVVGLMALASARGQGTGDTVPDLNRAASIWFERNVLLDNERWPKRALLEPINFPSSGELKVGKGTSSVPIRARAIEYAIHDRSVPDRWRAATLRDLREQDLGISDVPTDSELAAAVSSEPRESEVGFTVDEVKLALERMKTVRAALEEDQKKTVSELFFGDRGDRARRELPIIWTGLERRARAMEKPQALMEQVDRVTADTSSLRRGLRKLIVPEDVTVKYRGENKRGDVTLKKQAENVYEGKIDDLTESLEFTLRAEDYVSDPRRITVVPPPRVIRLEQEESSPAYLYYMAEKNTRTLPAAYAGTAGLLALPLGPGMLAAAAALPPERPIDDDQLLLARRKQDSATLVRSVAGEARPEVQLLASSDLILRVVTDKDLDPESVTLDAKGAARLRGIKPTVLDGHTFEVRFRNVRGKLDFRFEFTDTDGVPGAQDILITSKEDDSPTITQFKPEVIRMVGENYMITPEALIPFSFVVQDDYGLSRLEYVWTLLEAAAADEDARRYARVAGAIGLSLSGPEVPLTSLVYNQALPITLRRNEDSMEGRTTVPHFQSLIKALRAEMNEAAIAKDLRKRVAVEKIKDRVPELAAYIFKEVGNLDPYLRDHKEPVDNPAVPTKGFDVSLLRRIEDGIEMPLKARELEVQKRYTLRISLEAYDTNVEKPGRGWRKSSKTYPFVIVSDTELLYEIGKEEERLYDELSKSYEELAKMREQTSSLRFDIPANAAELKENDFVNFSTRVEAVEKAIRETLRITVKVASDYDRIYREMRTNRIQNSNPQRVEDVSTLIVQPLAKIQDNEFRYSLLELGRLRKALDNTTLAAAERLKASRDRVGQVDNEVKQLIEVLNNILTRMRGVVKLNELKDQIRELARKEAEAAARIRKEHKIQEEELFKGLGLPDKKP